MINMVFKTTSLGNNVEDMFISVLITVKTLLKIRVISTVQILKEVKL